MSTEKVGKIYAAMAAIMRDVPAIGKDSRNQSQGFNFRSIDTIYAELHNILVRHGVITVPVKVEAKTDERVNKNGTLMRFTNAVFTWWFMADDGSFIEASMIGEGCDSGDKSCSKAASIAHKYLFLQTFAISSEELPDPDYESHELAPKEQQSEEQQPEEPTFSGKNHEALYQEFLNAFINPDQFLEAMKFNGEIPKQAKSFWAMKDETAAKFLGRIPEIEGAIKEYTNHKPNQQ